MVLTNVKPRLSKEFIRKIGKQRSEKFNSEQNIQPCKDGERLVRYAWDR